MVASIIQLENVGMQDAYLTKNPSINIFKYKYYRYVNFATEMTRVVTEGVINFGKSVTVIVPGNGDLLSKLYLRVKLPKLTALSGTYASWSNTIGYAIFNGGVSLEIGGTLVDTFYPDFKDIYDSFTGEANLGKNLMIGRSDSYFASRYNAVKDLELVIPLEFWFTKDYKLSLPIISMPTQDIRIKFKLREFSECINYDGDIPPEPVNISESEVFAEYIYLDSSIVRDFAYQPHSFLIEQVRYNGEEKVNQNAGNHNSILKFNNACKELVFAIKTSDSVLANDRFNYSDSDDGPIVKDVELLLNGNPRFPCIPEIMNRLLYANSVHNSVPLKYVYCIPFCIKPEDHQPTGTLNMSRIDNVVLSLKLQGGSPEAYLDVYAISYNLITIENGVFTIHFPL